MKLRKGENMLDFQKIINENKVNNIINPREIFMSLPNKIWLSKRCSDRSMETMDGKKKWKRYNYKNEYW